eukprot:9356884-Pyramimonas_sp.AAC.1
MDQSDAGSAGIFSRWTNQAQEARVYSHNGPIISGLAGAADELRLAGVPPGGERPSLGDDLGPAHVRAAGDPDR